MINKPIYAPTGKAKEYGDLAINIYTGCPHNCFYCFAPNVLHKDREEFHAHVEPRSGIVEAVKKQIEREKITDKLIHLCFTCDPYPMRYDTTATREIIKIIKESGNHVQILTKGDGSRDFDLLDDGDWYGVTLDGCRDHAYPTICSVLDIEEAHNRGIKTWVSFEPILDLSFVIYSIKTFHECFDKIKIGKLNYFSSDIDWAECGRQIEELCNTLGVDYYIKESLREEMNKKGETKC